MMVQTLAARFQRSLTQLAALGVVKGWMRLGYAAKGVLYLSVGLFALGESVGLSLPLLGTEGILRVVTRQPLGIFLLFLLAVGIAGYAFWRFVQAIADPEHSDTGSPLNTVQRLGYAMSGLSYASLVYAAAELMTALQQEQDDTIEDLAAQLLESAWGVLLLLLAGLSVVGVGLVYVYGGLSGSYISQFKATCHSHVETLATWLGQIGYTARGVAFTVIGIGLIQAALLAQPEAAGGLDVALEKVSDQPYGRIGLGIIATGFIAYALYALFASRYRWFNLNSMKTKPR
ncbi:DUF1206 domain-containing protein [Vacuolonema iberomarrocanum]|uniref:DUF1206 domain-containing protein n=1 Tax=Vacuolonema iberomarrocanum TaxID=3454632 RepID=UPI0019F29207|nr:DUF1206 domain-containing protein [filamentous cyanobacterium LEGE 07170]